ncbi:phenylacetate-CoA ligase [Melghirimyces profundicolus]|uniref:Phenylacetate-coenzyme A ligase n=1 Tax=Melghirimyces profundicolus TaxID=1242148 RepID=A0A2T6C4W7_9BACL|nr:phenylacetate--CoA ligase [Melghirimyces profundicolus]PTX63327.1 phenylacetate-CoA ligase [Melghirimyces profundicolus]
MFQPELETMDRPELERLQADRLKQTVERVYNLVPFYRRRLDKAGVKPGEIGSLEDLPRLPFTWKKDFRDHYPFGLFAVELEEVARIHASSGTRGKPTVVGYTQNDLRIWAEVCARALVIAGGRPGDVFHNAYGYGLFTGGLGLHYGAERLKATVVPVSGGNRVRQAALIRDFRPRGIGGTPSFVLSLAETMEEMGVDPRSTTLEYGIFGAEPWSEEMRRTLEEKWGIDALDIYGLSEVIGPGVSMECPKAKDGLHIAEDHFLPEVVDPETGDPLPDGAYGELVFTSLTKEALPVLRYRTGDIASLIREPCRCGRTHTRMSRIKGRIDDMLIIRGVNVFPSEMEAVVLEEKEVAPHYRLVVTKEGTMDRLTLEVEISEDLLRSTEGHFDPGHERCGQVCNRLQQRLKELLGITTEVSLKEPKSIPRSEGKAVRVIDRRKEAQPG